MYKWQDLPWQKIEKAVFKLQKRIYQASQRGDTPTVHKLQRLLLKSWSARCLAVRRVTQDNRGKHTAGVDGVKSLSPEQRLELVETLNLGQQARPLRRVWIEKAGTTEKRPLSIPCIANRAEQALVKLALEPEWEARFEANSYGFRPGRSAHDAIEAIFLTIKSKAKYVLDADIAKCFDRVNHQALLAKLKTFPTLRRTIRAWLQAGVLDGQELFPMESGVPQGGVASPLLMNIALHGLETAIVSAYPNTHLIRYADDLVALHPKLNVIEQVQQTLSHWLAELGLELKPNKTQITHTLKPHRGQVGFDFLGFHIRQYPVGKAHSGKTAGRNPKLLGFKTIIQPSKEAQRNHQLALKAIIKPQPATSQERLIAQLNPVIRGWCNYHATVCSQHVFSKMEHLTFTKLYSWAKRRHPKTSRKKIVNKYWRLEQGQWLFAPGGGKSLYHHGHTPIKRHIKVKGTKSPYDGDWLYWAQRKSKQPGLPKRIAVLLNRQAGQCGACGLYFNSEETVEVDHIIPHSQGGQDAYHNWQLLHTHCHHRKSAQEL
jgi:RNA-directed DNA polymerase